MAIMVHAHRGASAYAPENTAPAFRLAVEMNSDGVENDIRLTKDGYYVLSHDDRIDRMSNGKGFVKDMTLAELMEYDFSGGNPKFSGTKICTLEEFLDIVKDMKVVNIELKSVESEACSQEEAFDKLYNAIVSAGCLERTIISCFDHVLVSKLKDAHPDLRTGLLYGDALTPEQTVARVRERKADAIHPHFGALTKEIIDACKAEGIDINVWTIDTVDVADTYISYGVTGIISNVPDVILNRLK